MRKPTLLILFCAEMCPGQHPAKGWLEATGVPDPEDHLPDRLFRGSDAVQLYRNFTADLTEDVIFQTNPERLFHLRYGCQRVWIRPREFLDVLEYLWRLIQDD